MNFFIWELKCQKCCYIRYKRCKKLFLSENLANHWAHNVGWERCVFCFWLNACKIELSEIFWHFISTEKSTFSPDFMYNYASNFLQIQTQYIGSKNSFVCLDDWGSRLSTPLHLNKYLGLPRKGRWRRSAQYLKGIAKIYA